MSSSPVKTGLRSLHADDLDMVRAWRNHIDVRRYMYTQHLISEAEHRAWFKCANEDPAKHLLIFERDGQPVGFVNISVIDSQAQRAEWGFYLAHAASPGSGKLLGKHALRHAFDKLQLHKVCGEALVYNERSIRFHERFGFIQEARLRDHHFNGLEYHDVIGFGLLASEWRQNQGVQSS